MCRPPRSSTGVAAVRTRPALSSAAAAPGGYASCSSISGVIHPTDSSTANPCVTRGWGFISAFEETRPERPVGVIKRLAGAAGHTILRDHCGGLNQLKRCLGSNGDMVFSRESLTAAIIDNLKRFYY